MRLELEVFGRRMVAEHAAGEWRLYHRGDEGKRRPAHDLRVPPEIQADELARYLADLCHEWATPELAEVQVLNRRER